MRVYDAMARLFPRSLVAKLFAISVLFGQLPLILLMVLGRDGPTAGLGWAGAVLILGSAGTVAGMRAVLRPLDLASAALGRAVRPGQAPGPALPQHYRDPLGLLMRRVGRLASAMEERPVETGAPPARDPQTGLPFTETMRRRLPASVEGGMLLIEVRLEGRETLSDPLAVEIAAVLGTNMRGGDLLARDGETRFLAFLGGIDPEAATLAAQRLRESVEARGEAAGVAFEVAAGVAAGSGDPEALVRRAEAALAEAKARGHNRTWSSVTASTAA